MTEESSQNKPTIFSIWANTYRRIVDNPVVILPFCIIVFIELLALAVLYFFPREPIKSILGPVIEQFFTNGKMYMHYPANFLLMPKLLYWARVVISIVFGSLAIGVSGHLFNLIRQKKPAHLSFGIKVGFKKYISIAVIQIFLYFLYNFVQNSITVVIGKYFVKSGNKAFLGLSANIWQGPILFSIDVILGIIIQLFFIYMYMDVLFGKAGFFKSMLNGIILSFRLFFRTFMLLLVPTLVYLPLAIIIYNLGTVMDRFFPEITMLILAVNVILGSLILDPCIILSCAESYLSKEKS